MISSDTVRPCGAIALLVGLSAAGFSQTSTAPATIAIATMAATPPPAPAAPAVRLQLKSAPGIYAVYPVGKRWMLVDRSRRPSLKLGTNVLVIGSKAADVFRVAKSSTAWDAACLKGRPTRTWIYWLSGRNMSGAGIPVIAIAMARNARINPAAAKFYPLSNQVGEDTYAALESPLRQRVAAELRSGEFALDPQDDLGRSFLQDPKPEDIQVKIDFGAAVPAGGAAKAFVLVDGVQVSKTYRRCMRLAMDGLLTGTCAEMPHPLLAETNALDFVAYDPNGDGHPFVLAYTTREPLWGHERWGFRMSESQGPSVFFMDALDPKCRERF